jgi:hypothetical protein
MVLSFIDVQNAQCSNLFFGHLVCHREDILLYIWVGLERSINNIISGGNSFRIPETLVQVAGSWVEL